MVEGKGLLALCAAAASARAHTSGGARREEGGGALLCFASLCLRLLRAPYLPDSHWIMSVLPTMTSTLTCRRLKTFCCT